ncbi:MAG TPA: hypothetical protein VD695_07515 [Gaiellaceae bacterium]|nr:hypothetical protein [Gaiellaceae bacterium]
MSTGPTVVRLLTLVDVVEAARDRVSFSARLEAVLADGRRALLLDDRGWTIGSNTVGDLRTELSAQEIEEDARTVVGPDEPPDGRSQEEESALHWGSLAETLRRAGIAADASQLSRLPHDVVLSDRARALAVG